MISNGIKIGQRLLVGVGAWLLAVLPVHAAISYTLTFEDVPVPAPQQQFGVSSYTEDNFFVKPMGALTTNLPYRLVRNGGEVAGFAHNGSPFLQVGIGGSLELTHLAALWFTPVSVDLAEYSTLFHFPMEVLFTGYLAEGGTVSTSFLLDGIIDGVGGQPDFQTFFFPAEFNNLVRLETASTPFSIDNLSLLVIPEPGSLWMLIAGLALTARKRKSKGFLVERALRARLNL